MCASVGSANNKKASVDREARRTSTFRAKALRQVHFYLNGLAFVFVCCSIAGERKKEAIGGTNAIIDKVC